VANKEEYLKAEKGTLTNRYLTQLIQEQLRRYLPDSSAETSWDKTSALEALHAKAGWEPILSLGQRLKQLAKSPVIKHLQSATSLLDFHNRWQRLERFGHTTNRTRIASSTTVGSTTVLEIHHHSRGGRKISRVDNIFIWGLLIALYSISGFCVATYLALPGQRKYQLSADGKLLATQRIPRNTERLLVYELTQNQRSCQRVKPAPVTRAGTNTVSRLQALVDSDPGGRWTVQGSAQRLGLSPRSFQRQLSNAGVSFSRILLERRLNYACHLLSSSKISLTEIAYCCGFSDQAHFSRSFSKQSGVAPQVYRHLTKKT